MSSLPSSPEFGLSPFERIQTTSQPSLKQPFRRCFVRTGRQLDANVRIVFFNSPHRLIAILSNAAKVSNQVVIRADQLIVRRRTGATSYIMWVPGHRGVSHSIRLQQSHLLANDPAFQLQVRRHDGVIMYFVMSRIDQRDQTLSRTSTQFCDPAIDDARALSAGELKTKDYPNSPRAVAPDIFHERASDRAGAGAAIRVEATDIRVAAFLLARPWTENSPTDLPRSQISTIDASFNASAPTARASASVAHSTITLLLLRP